MSQDLLDPPLLEKLPAPGSAAGTDFESPRVDDPFDRRAISLVPRLPDGAPPIVGRSAALMNVLHEAEQVAATNAVVLILGETGTGKEILAHYIHALSSRARKPFLATNVAAIPATLLESELFGREKGAYTGALSRQIGRFEAANEGTLLLDEIGEMPIEVQVKLLRVLQCGEFERLGSSLLQKANVRLIAATNRNLPELIRGGAFRQDLYYRINVFPITLPPLRDRREDIPLLVWACVKELSEKMGKPIERVCPRGMDALMNHDWPGNVRELRNVVEHSMILNSGRELRLILPTGDILRSGRRSRRLVDVEREHILDVLKTTGNKIYGRNGAAGILDIKPTTLYSLMKRLGIERAR